MNKGKSDYHIGYVFLILRIGPRQGLRLRRVSILWGYTFSALFTLSFCKGFAAPNRAYQGILLSGSVSCKRFNAALIPKNTENVIPWRSNHRRIAVRMKVESVTPKSVA